MTVTQIHEQNLPIPEENITLQDVPSISVDRALGHLFDGLEIDFEAIKSFYDSLPHEDKPSLSELSIHFSASSLIGGEAGNPFLTSGIMLWDGTKENKPNTSPELPKTKNPTIIVYVGSSASVMPDNAGEFGDKLMAEDLTNTLSHELTHYAQGRAHKRQGKVKKLGTRALIFGGRSAYGILTDTRWVKVGTQTLLASELLSDSSLPNSIGISASSAALIHLAGTGKRRRQNEESDFTSYKERDREHNARQHEDDSLGLVESKGFKVNKELTDALTINNNSNPKAVVKRTVSRIKHKKQALRAPDKSKL